MPAIAHDREVSESPNSRSGFQIMLVLCVRVLRARWPAVLLSCPGQRMAPCRPCRSLIEVEYAADRQVSAVSSCLAFALAWPDVSDLPEQAQLGAELVDRGLAILARPLFLRRNPATMSPAKGLRTGSASPPQTARQKPRRPGTIRTCLRPGRRPGKRTSRTRRGA